MFDLHPSEAKLMATYGLKTLTPTSLKDINYHEFTVEPDEVSELTTEQQYNMLLELIDSEQQVVDTRRTSQGEESILMELIAQHKGPNREDLNQSYSRMERQVRGQSENLRTAIESNFVHFVNTKQKIDDSLIDFVKLKTRAQQDRSSSRVFNPQRRSVTNKEGLTSELEENISNLMTSTSELIQPINKSKQKEDKVSKMAEFIKANQHFFDLPKSLVYSLSLNKNEKFIDDYNRYIHDKDRFLTNFNNKYSELVLKLTNENNTPALRALEQDRKLKLSLISKVFQEIDTIAQQYRNKAYQEFLSLDHEVSKSHSNSKFISLVDSLSRLNFDSKMAHPIADFLTKQIEVVDQDFSRQVEKFDGKFLIAQNKLVDYIRSLNPDRREGSHINYINEKYDTYKEDIGLTTRIDQKLLIIKEAFESNDSLDLSLINETWLVLYNFINYLDNILLSNIQKFLNNYVHYIKLGIDPNGEIRDLCVKLINQVVLILVALFDDENGDNNQLESAPKNYKQFVPYYSNSLSAIYHLTRVNDKVNKIMNSFGDIIGTIGNASQYADTNKVIKNMKSSSAKVNQKILEAVCATWVNDCSQFYELEDWSLDTERERYKNNGKCTKLMSIIQCYQLYVLLKISELVVYNQTSEYKIVAAYPSKRMLVSIEIQFMRSLNIIVDSMMKKYNLDRQEGGNSDDLKDLQVFKILTMNNFDKLSRVIYPELLSQFDRFFDKDLLKQNLKLFADIDKASLTIIDDILNIEKLFVAQQVNKFFHTNQNPQVMKVDGFIYEVLIHFVKLINKIKPLTSQEVYITIINELQLNLLKNMIDNVRQVPLKRSLSYVNLKLDANFILVVFEKSKLLQLNDSSYKYLQILLNDLENKNKELFLKGEQFGYAKKDFDQILDLSMQDSSNEFSCF
ncbi:Exocyst complex component SEC5 [Candida viswanathii]|uniref:Exocyst complex component SEC5 n=1 Tax=Candida viswanathii TaxID=5486 RepID=A0A367YG69_9ASCO|nr:Exocyst complex component SEC5 [Candida viswanathii]